MDSLCSIVQGFQGKTGSPGPVGVVGPQVSRILGCYSSMIGVDLWNFSRTFCYLTVESCLLQGRSNP